MFSFSLGGLDIKESGVDKLKEPEGGPQVARSKLYGLLAMSFYVPDDEDFERARSGKLQTDINEAAEELPYDMDLSLAPVPDDWTSEFFHSEFLRLFEVGQGGPPCPLYGGVYGADRMRTIEEVTRFYKYFGLKTSEDRRIPPDHISTELEFLHYLTYREAAAPMPPLAEPYKRAQLDFIDRQPGRWMPGLVEKVEGADAPAFFASLVGLAHRLVSEDCRHLQAGDSA